MWDGVHSMARIEFKGISNYTKKLEKLGISERTTIGKSIYAAADIVTDAIRQNIQALPTQAGSSPKGELRSGISPPQKQGLLDSLGIASVQQDAKGFYNVKVGFDGYNSVKTKAYPKGQPNAMIARSAEGGSSIMAPHPFVAPAVRKTRRAAEKKMKEIVDAETKKIMG